MDNVSSQLIDLALLEDVGAGDVTSLYFVDGEAVARGVIEAREAGVVAGVEVAVEVFRRVDAELEVRVGCASGSLVERGTVIMEVKGRARSILTGERVALNFLQRLSGVATKTRGFVDRVAGTGARILDTRKTTPGWRFLEKAAVRAGGGMNHRMGLYDRAMVKDNHLVAEGGLAAMQEAIWRLRREKPGVEVEVEADRLDQYEGFLGLEGVDYLLLDNMDCETMRRAVAMRGGARPYLEASGGVTLETVGEIARTGVDFISVGALTHSAVALDLALNFIGE